MSIEKKKGYHCKNNLQIPFLFILINPAMQNLGFVAGFFILL